MRKVQVIGAEKTFDFELRQDNGFFYVRQNGTEHRADLVRLGNNRYSLLLDGASYEIGVRNGGDGYSISTGSHSHDFHVEDFEIARMKKRAGIEDSQKTKSLMAPMPGLIVAVNCGIGDMAKPGQPLLIMEAMKMENDIKAPVAGTIKKISVTVGQSVDKGQMLVEFE